MNKISLAFISDNKFIIPTTTAITSIIKNKNPSSYYEIYVITNGLDNEGVFKLNELNFETVEIKILNAKMEKFTGLHKFETDGYISATETALLKFDIPNLLPDLDKVLYLDGDIIVLKDLTELFNTVLADNYAAVVQDSGKLYFKDIYEEYSNMNYFNSGMMLLNLREMRENNITEKLIETKRNSTNGNLMDQNIFNTVFGKNIKLLDIKYNFLAINLKRASKHWNMKQINGLYNSNYKNFYDIMKNAVILHYSSKDKPWKYKGTLFGDIWHQYYEISPYKDVKLSLLPKPKKKIPFAKRIFSYEQNNNKHKILRLCGITISIKSKKSK